MVKDQNLLNWDQEHDKEAYFNTAVLFYIGISSQRSYSRKINKKQIGKDDLIPYTDGMILYTENTKECTKKLRTNKQIQQTCRV